MEYSTDVSVVFPLFSKRPNSLVLENKTRNLPAGSTNLRYIREVNGINEKYLLVRCSELFSTNATVFLPRLIELPYNLQQLGPAESVAI